MSGAVHARAMDALGRVEERRQQTDGLQNLERAGLDRRGPRLPVRMQFPLNKPRLNAVAGKLGGGEQPGRARADDQNLVSHHASFLGRAPVYEIA